MIVLIQEWKTHFQGFERNLRLFLMFNFIWNIGIGMFSLVYNLYIKSLGYDQTMVGNVVGMTALASAAALIPAGVLNDRIGAKRVVLVGLALAVAAFTARALSVSPGSLLLSAFLGGVFLAMISVTVLPFMANHSTPAQRVHLISFNMALQMLSNVVGIMLGGALSDTFQFAAGLTETASLRLTLMIGVGTAALGLIPVRMIASTPPQSKETVSLLRLGPLWKHHKTSLQVIAIFSALGLMLSTAGGMVVPYLNVYFEDRFHSSKTMIGIIVALGQGATAVAYFIGPLLSKRMSDSVAVIWLQLSSIPFLLITAFSANFYLSCSGYLFRQALMNAANPFHSAIKMRYVERSLRGLASSTGEATHNLGWFVAAPLSTWIVVRYGAYYGYAYAFTITAVVYTVYALLFYMAFGGSRFAPVEEPAERH